MTDLLERTASDLAQRHGLPVRPTTIEWFVNSEPAIDEMEAEARGWLAACELPWARELARFEM